MITISLAAFGMAALKMAVSFFAMMFIAMFTLWPINDSKVSWIQKLVFCLLSLTVDLFIFGAIRFTA